VIKNAMQKGLNVVVTYNNVKKKTGVNQLKL